MSCDTAVHIIADSTRNWLAREKWTQDISCLISACPRWHCRYKTRGRETVQHSYATITLEKTLRNRRLHCSVCRQTCNGHDTELHVRFPSEPRETKEVEAQCRSPSGNPYCVRSLWWSNHLEGEGSQCSRLIRYALTGLLETWPCHLTT